MKIIVKKRKHFFSRKISQIIDDEILFNTRSSFFEMIVESFVKKTKVTVAFASSIVKIELFDI